MNPLVIGGLAIAAVFGYAWWQQKKAKTAPQHAEPYSQQPAANVQHALALLGYPVEQTGAYDAQTVTAVKTYQSRHGGLAVDGIVGPLTWGAIQQDLADIGLSS